MSDEQYALVRSLEATHWWFVGTRELFLRRIEDFARGRVEPLTVLDAGCGSGKLLSELPAACMPIGVDLNAESLINARGRESETRSVSYARGSIEHLPFDSGGFDVVVSVDVLSNLGVQDDSAVLRELHRVLSPGGTLLLNLPAYEWLTSGHDAAAGTRHRYTAHETKRLLDESGFAHTRAGYRVSAIFPAAAVVRLAKRRSAATDVAPVAPWANRLLLASVRAENALLPKVSLPFGLSVFAEARKPR